MDRKKGVDWSLDASAAEEDRHFHFLITGRGTIWQNIVALVCLALAIFSVIFVLTNSLFGGMDGWIRRSAFLAIGLIYVFLIFPLGRKSWLDKPNAWLGVDLMFIVGTVLSELYIVENYRRIAAPFSVNDPIFTLVGAFLIVAVLEATRRCLSPVVVIVPLFFILHAVYASYFPGFLRGPGVHWDHLIDITVNIDTLFGIALEVVVSILALFLLFGAILMETRVAAFFLSLANSMTGHQVGGPAKVGVIGSGFLATISGSAVGNVASTGAITIPAMKRAGYTPEVAGGIEAAASNGGHICPPVMGLVAFLIAGTIGMAYAELIVRAAVPAALYFFAIYLAVDLWARKHNMSRLDKRDLPNFLAVIKEGGILLLPLFTIIVVLFLEYSTTMAALAGVVSAFLISFVKHETRLDPLKVMIICERFMKITAPLIVACGMIGIILGALFASGVGSSFASNVYQLAGGAVFPTLLAVAFASIILGMGMPVIAVYIVIATLIVPAMVQLGSVELLQAHLFVFYFAVASGVTPPVCIVAFAAASIAGSDPMRTGYQAFWIGFAKYLIPILFFYKAGLLLYGSYLDIASAIVFSTIAISCTTVGIQRYLFRHNNWYETLGFAVSVILLVPDDLTYNVAGALLAYGVAAGQYLSSNRESQST